RSEGEIRRTLDRAGKRDGVCFSRGMERFCGGPQVAERVTLTHLPRWQHPVGEWYVLDGARCDGEPLAAHGPCHRRCAFLWHRDWLEFEP
ncbi:MAG TPA: hypothetical protein VE152_08880, partial [Acidimicrobiales bacterium]|nr:hypothetical protein [Acidimicrobiales bacterium]